MRAYSLAFAEDLPPPQVRGSPQARGDNPTGGAYVVDVPAASDAKRVAFSTFVKRALANAKEARGLTPPKIAAMSGIGTTTIYRWRDGDWRKSPDAEQVVAFCDALGIPFVAASSILWPSKADRPTPSVPLSTEPDLEVLARRLADPNVPEREKFLIREVIRGLAARSGGPGPGDASG